MVGLAGVVAIVSSGRTSSAEERPQAAESGGRRADEINDRAKPASGEPASAFGAAERSTRPVADFLAPQSEMDLHSSVGHAPMAELAKRWSAWSILWQQGVAAEDGEQSRRSFSGSRSGTPPRPAVSNWLNDELPIEPVPNDAG